MTDLWWDPSGNVVLLGGLAPDSGAEQLAKALYRRLITYPGELPAHPEYGCRLRDYLGQPMSRWVARLAALEAERGLLQDPRVQSVQVEVEGEGEALAVRARVTPVEGLGYDEILITLVVGPEGVSYYAY